MGVAHVTLDNPPANSYDLEVMRKFAAAGVARVNLWVPPKPRDEVLPILDNYAKLAATPL